MRSILNLFSWASRRNLRFLVFTGESVDPLRRWPIRIGTAADYTGYARHYRSTENTSRASLKSFKTRRSPMDSSRVHVLQYESVVSQIVHRDHVRSGCVGRGNRRQEMSRWDSSSTQQRGL